jgi:ribosomal protein S4
MLPTFTIPREISLVDLCILVGFAKSKSEARRMIEQGGIRLAGKKLVNPKMIIVWPEDVK